jgi:DNA-binding NarL/FixJ family response regulator
MEPHPPRVACFSEDSFVTESLPQTLQRILGADVTQITQLSALKRTLACQPPDLLVLDAHVARRNTPVHPYALAINAHDVAPAAPIVMLIDLPNMALISMLMRQGVRGVVVRLPDGVTGVLEALPAVLSDAIYLCPQAKAALLNAAPVPGLSVGDVSLIRMLAQGLTDRRFTRKAMARALNVQDNTLGVRIHQLRAKLGVYDEEDIVALARGWGVLE